MPIRVCHIEPGSIEAITDPSYEALNVATMSMHHCYDWKPRADITQQLTRLKSLPRHLRAVGLPWYFEPELGLTTDQWRLKTQELADTILAAFPNEPKPLSLGFCDCEDTHDRAEMSRALEPLAAICDVVCNFNDADYGKAWWGSYSGKVSTAASFECYNLTNNENMRSAFDVIRKHQVAGVESIGHLPICLMPKTFSEKTFDMQGNLSRTRQLINYASQYGAKRFILAEYMLRDLSESDRLSYVRNVSLMLKDADLIWPLDEPA